MAVEQQQAADDANVKRQGHIAQAALELIPALGFGEGLVWVLGLPQRDDDGLGQPVVVSAAQEVPDGVTLGRPAGEPCVDVRLGDLGEPGAAVVEPGEEVQGDPDLLARP